MILHLQTNGDSIINFDIPLEYNGYGIGLVSVTGKLAENMEKQLFLCSDIIEESFVGNKKLPVLHALRRKENGFLYSNIFNILYLRIVRPTISSIRLYICDEEGQIVSLKKKHLNCTLLIVPTK